MTYLHRNRFHGLACGLLLALSVMSFDDLVNARESGATPRALSSRSAEAAIAAAMSEDGQLHFDVALDVSDFAFDPDLTDSDGMPAYGASFIIRGYIYPAGLLSEGRGVNADGSPEFPDQVLGEWVCRGWFVGEGMRTTTGPFVVSTQIYSFGDEPGAAALVSDGYEFVDVGKQFNRAITGGTGTFVGVGGEARQGVLGMNGGRGLNLQFELELAGGDA